MKIVFHFITNIHESLIFSDEITDIEMTWTVICPGGKDDGVISKNSIELTPLHYK